MKNILKKSVMLFPIIILISISSAKEIEGCYKQLQQQETRNAGLLVAIEKCDDQNQDLKEKLFKSESKKNKEWVVKLPFIDAGLEVAEARACIITLASIYIHPIFSVTLLF